MTELRVDGIPGGHAGAGPDADIRGFVDGRQPRDEIVSVPAAG